MKTNFWGSKSNRNIEIMMTPMIDVVFLLLVFFLATTSFEMIERMLPSGVSQQNTAASATPIDTPPDPTQDVDELVLRLTLDDRMVAQVSLNGQPLSGVDELKQRLRVIGRTQSDLTVIVDPESNVPMGPVITVYDAARDAGLQKIYMAVK